ncbi:4562_t:CDS:2, partial [Entrophospora sp. SA101]
TYYFLDLRVVLSKNQCHQIQKHEIYFKTTTVVKDCDDDDSIEESNFTLNTYIDLIGIIKTIDIPRDIFIQSTKKKVRRQIISIADKDNNEIKITLWGEYASNPELAIGSVVVMKYIHVTSYKGSKINSNI